MTDSTTNGNGAEQAVLSAAGSCEAKMQLIVAEDWVIQAVTFKTVSANFTLTPTPATQSVGEGSNASYAIAVNAINGFTSPVTFTTCAGLPAGDGLACTVSPASVNPGCERDAYYHHLGNHPASNLQRHHGYGDLGSANPDGDRKPQSDGRGTDAEFCANGDGAQSGLGGPGGYLHIHGDRHAGQRVQLRGGSHLRNYSSHGRASDV